jgi:two-component system cell cycle sensor histidine kinase/response regulator CckA
MIKKPSYDELENKVQGLERELEECRRTVKALQQSEESYRSILELAPDSITISRIGDGRFLQINNSFCQLSGYQPEEVIGRTVIELGLMNPADRERLLEILRQQGRSVGLEIEYRVKNGSKVDILISSRPIRFQGQDCLLAIGTDITGFKEAQQALRESEEKHRNILESMEEIYYEMDLSGNLIFFNDALLKTFGRIPEEIMGINYREFTSPEEAERLLSIFNEVYRTGTPNRLTEITIIRIDGVSKVFEGSVSLIKNSAGNPTGFRGLLRDKTEQKLVEKALRESEEKYRHILENMEEGYYEVDLAGNRTFINEALCKMYGYSYDEMLGINYRKFMASETAKKIFQVYNEVYRTGVPARVVDYEAFGKDGSVIMPETSVSLLRNAAGEAVGFYGISRDVTERKKTEKALRESEEKYRLLVENANDGIFILHNGMVKFSNPSMKALTGYSAEALAERPFVDLLDPKDKDAFVEQQRKKSKNDQPGDIPSFRIISQANETLWVELNTIPIVWEGRPATLNFLRDVTAQKKMEAQFLQAQKMEAVGTLAGGIAHDFNNILMGIQGNASLILLDVDPHQPHHDKLKGIEQLVKAGAELTKQLLGVARRGKYEIKPTDLNRLIGKSADLFGRTRKEIDIHKQFQEGVWPVEVDRSQIEQVLLNLYVNAWHAMPEGGSLFLETRNMVLDDYYVKPLGVVPGRYVRISVTDNGTGMDEETRKRVFDPFFTTKEMGRGTGLGLASAYGIIRNHKGIINVYSEKGQGTTFNLYLPVTEKEVIKEMDSQEEVIEGMGVILFTDDEEPITKIGRLILERLGYQVRTAVSGYEAIEIYRQEGNRIDLVILDMIMPGINGGDTFDRLKEIDSEVKVLLSSGYSINGQAKSILDRGCKGFIQKPFNVADLSKKVRQILDLGR